MAPCGEPHDNVQDLTSHLRTCDPCEARKVNLVTDNGRGSIHTFVVPVTDELVHGYAYGTAAAARRARDRIDPGADVIQSIDTDRPAAYALTTTKENTTP